ncbi:MAG: DUF1778 domain-containing protein [Desulfobacterales bacterium]
MIPDTEKIEQISAEIPIHIYHALEAASEIRGESLHHFLIQSAYEKARLIIEQERIIKLSGTDSEKFFQYIDNPPEPSEKLIEAIRISKNMTVQC